MVLRQKPTTQGIRFIFGIGIIALSIYLFYIALAKNNSPELFLIPETKAAQESLCSTETIGDYFICLPEGITLSRGTEMIEVLSLQKRIRGSIEFMNTLPMETQWRQSLKNPLIKLFIKDMDDMDTFHLMLTILEYRYNPSLMGAKAKLIPPWMKNNPSAAIIIPEGREALLFYTPSQLLGLVFSGKDIVMLSLTGNIDQIQAISIMDSVKPI
ncbi:MAG: hypothetical protein JXM72_07455 [Deltaproteobacteria bacterium]|nr:hypothetical protein [Deltaproteobacteria bacterium]